MIPWKAILKAFMASSDWSFLLVFLRKMPPGKGSHETDKAAILMSESGKAA